MEPGTYKSTSCKESKRESLSCSRTARPVRWGITSANAIIVTTGTKHTTVAATATVPIVSRKTGKKWIGKRMEELLPTGYYHLVFTIPHQLNALCLQNKRQLYAILFKAASETVLELGKDQKHLGAETGLITVLHTWGQNMMEHPHLHCIMPAGGLTEDKSNWVLPTKGQDFFVHYKVLSAKFRGKFLDLLQQAYNKSALSFHARLLPLAGKRKFNAFMSDLYKKQWVVNIQKPIAHPKKILEYLSRYVFRIAISDRRIIKIENGIVHFTMKDYKKGGIFREMKLELNEFIRRFLLHILPKGFMKIRYLRHICQSGAGSKYRHRTAVACRATGKPGAGRPG
jgi:hypothetical protein